MKLSYDIDKILKIAEKENQNKIFFAAGGLGDGLMLAGAMSNLKNCQLNKTNKLLITHKYKKIFENNPNIEFIDFGFYVKTYLDETKELIYNLHEKGIDLIFLDYWSKALINREFYYGYGKRHMITELSDKSGCFGKINLKPNIFLTEDEKKFGRFFGKNQIAISSISSGENKDYNDMQELIFKLKDKYNFVQIGLFSDPLLKGVLDKRGILSIREVASVLYNSDVFVGLMGGLMHLARAVDCRSVIAFTGVEPTYWSGYSANLNVVSDIKCNLCLDKFVGFEKKCINANKYICSKGISINKMIAGIEIQMSKLDQKLEIEEVILEKKDTQINKQDPIEILSSIYIKNKIFLFNKILFLVIKRYIFHSQRYYFFGLFIILKIDKKMNEINVYLFTFLPFFKIKILEKERRIYLFNFIPFLKIVK